MISPPPKNSDRQQFSWTIWFDRLFEWINFVPVLLGSTGIKQKQNHMVTGSAALVAGAVTVTLTGDSVYTSASTYTVLVSRTVTNGWKVVNTNGSTFVITSSNLADTDTVKYVIIGW